jgi:serine/threonine-protein kinase
MIGHTIGKYTVTDRIGRGGMGTVYRAIDDTLHRDVAIKVLNAGLNDPEVARRFRAEAITVARLSHPGIATVYELFEHDGQMLMVMEFVRGVTLESLVEKSGALSAERGAELCLHALAALAHAHNLGVVHRDLKPANLMLTEAGVVKVMDFGIARVSGTDHLTTAGYMMGTPAYMAPEQVMGKKVDARVDLYAMGVVFYRLVSGAFPFKGESAFALAQSQVNDPPTPIGTVRADLPPWVEQIVSRALAKDPLERFQSAAAFHDALSRCLAGREPTVVADPSAPTEVMVTPPYAVSSANIKPLSGSVPALGGDTIPIVSGTARAAAANAAKAKAASFHRSNRFVLFGAAAIVVLTLGTAWIWSLVGRPADIVPPAATQPAETAPPTVAPAPPSAPTAQPSSPGPIGTTLPAQPATPPASDRSGAGPGANTTGRVTAPAGPLSGGPRRGFATFPDQKYFTISGTTAREHPAVLNIEPNAISVSPGAGGTPVQTMPIGTIRRATFVKADSPEFDRTLPNPRLSPGYNYPGVGTKNWLVLQSQKEFMIVRLDTATQQILDALTAARIKIVYATPSK